MLNGHINLDPLEVGNIIGLQATQKYCCKMVYSARCIEVKQEELRPERLTLFICLWGVRLHSVAMPGPSARWLCNWNDFLEQHISTVEHTHRFISEFFFFSKWWMRSIHLLCYTTWWSLLLYLWRCVCTWGKGRLLINFPSFTFTNWWCAHLSKHYIL